jgi:hypothetical protein
MTIEKAGRKITTLADWQTYAGPKGSDHWKDGRSAKEIARAWLEGMGPPLEMAKLLTGHPSFGPLESWIAEPEAKLPFDGFAGEPRNSDLVVHVVDSRGPYLIAVEAKADEPFGQTLAEALASALERLLANEVSNGLFRIQQLAQALFGARMPGDPAIKHMRYQLLTACAGAICEAERRGYSRTLLLIHEFVTTSTRDELHQANSTALGTFVKRLSHGAVTEVGCDSICGPFLVPGRPLFANTNQLFIGKVARDLRSGPRNSSNS